MSEALNPQRVEEIFRDCLLGEGEETVTCLMAEGIVSTVGFHPSRLYSHGAEIVALLAELPDTFKASGGGGMSFLNACVDRHGDLWTGEHRTVEQLLLLGMALGRVKCLLPREMWEVLPGGMPYYVVDDSGLEVRS